MKIRVVKNVPCKECKKNNVKHYAKGLCKTCYGKLNARKNRKKKKQDASNTTKT